MFLFLQLYFNLPLIGTVLVLRTSLLLKLYMRDYPFTSLFHVAGTAGKDVKSKTFVVTFVCDS